jgi:phosphomannomutase
MRNLSSNITQKKIELIDGIRINEEHAWVLVLPDDSHPMVHLYGEGDTMEARDAIIEDYSLKIKKFLSSI